MDVMHEISNADAKRAATIIMEARNIRFEDQAQA